MFESVPPPQCASTVEVVVVAVVAVCAYPACSLLWALVSRIRVSFQDGALPQSSTVARAGTSR